jgi:hypothetical protein
MNAATLQGKDSAVESKLYMGSIGKINALFYRQEKYCWASELSSTRVLELKSCRKRKKQKKAEKGARLDLFGYTALHAPTSSHSPGRCAATQCPAWPQPRCLSLSVKMATWPTVTGWAESS